MRVYGYSCPTMSMEDSLLAWLHDVIDVIPGTVIVRVTLESRGLHLSSLACLSLPHTDLSPRY
jgi:hypothetical protein